MIPLFGAGGCGRWQVGVGTMATAWWGQGYVDQMCEYCYLHMDLISQFILDLTNVHIQFICTDTNKGGTREYHHVALISTSEYDSEDGW